MVGIGDMKIYLTIDMGLFGDEDFVRFYTLKESKFSFDINNIRALLFVNSRGQIRLDVTDRYVLKKNFRRYSRALGVRYED